MASGAAAIGHARPHRTRRYDLVLVAVAILVVGALALLTIQLSVFVLAGLREGMLLDAGGLTTANFHKILSDPEFLRTLRNTLILGFGSVAVMLFFAVPLAWLYTRTDLPGKNLMMFLLSVKVAVPGFLVALGYIFLFNPSSGIVNKAAVAWFGLGEPPFNVYTLGWMAFLQGVAIATSAFFMLVPAFRALDAALEECAYASGIRPLKTAVRIVLPLVSPAIVACAIFYFIVAIELFDYAGMLGLPAGIFVFATWIYRLAYPEFGAPKYGEAAAIGLLLSLLAGAAVLLYLWSLRRIERLAVITGKRGGQHATPLGRKGTWLAWGFIALYLVLAAAIPLVMLVWSSLTPYLQPPSFEAIRSISLRHYWTALGEVPPLLKNTLILMVAVPTLAVSAGVCISWVRIKTALRGRQFLDVMMMATLAIPSIVGALAFLYLGISIYRFVPIYTTVWIIVLAMAARYVTWTSRVMNTALAQVHRELEEACTICGITRGRTFLSVLLPLVAPALGFSWLWVALLSVNELTIPVMLARQETAVMATTIWSLQAGGNSAVASAMGVMLVALIGLVVITFHRVLQRQPV